MQADTCAEIGNLKDRTHLGDVNNGLDLEANWAIQELLEKRGFDVSLRIKQQTENVTARNVRIEKLEPSGFIETINNINIGKKVGLLP